MLLLRQDARNLSLVSVVERERNAEKEAERVRLPRNSLLPAILGAVEEIHLGLRQLKPQLGLRARLGALERERVRPACRRHLAELLEIEIRRRLRRFQLAQDVEFVRWDLAAQEVLQLAFGRSNLELRALDIASELKHRDS